MRDRIYGDTTPVLELVMNPGESVLSWAADAAWMTKSIEMAPLDDAADRSWLGRMFRGRRDTKAETLVTFSAAQTPGMVAFCGRLPGSIVPLDIRPANDATTFVCAADALMCVEEGVSVTRVDDLPSLGTGLYGQGFSLLRLEGVGRAWVGLPGAVVAYDLRPEEIMRVHPGHFGIAQESVIIDVTTSEKVRTPSFPDGARLIELEGPGRVWMSSLGVGPVAEAIDDFSTPVEVTGSAQPAATPKARGVVREVLFPRP
jgi:uncharacterized protein (AIM24 family)